MSDILPIETVHLFPEIDHHLIELLVSLRQEDWDRPTLARQWSVRDIAAHLLDVNIRTLSASRDSHLLPPDQTIDGFESLVTYLNNLNATWVDAMRRVSPGMLIELLHFTNQSYNAHLKALKPLDKALYGVAWAGESESYNWFNIAREYTEKWHHQQQIRHATGHMAPLFAEHLYFPYLETSFRALPFHFHHIKAQENESIRVIVRGESDWSWTLIYSQEAWRFDPDPEKEAMTIVRIDGDVAWRIFSRQISRDEVLEYTDITGDQALAEHLLHLKAVMV